MLENPQMLLLILPILLFSIVIHEMAHGYAALFQGDPTAKNMGRLTLNPLVHLDPIWSVAVPTLTMVLGGFFFGMAKPVLYNPNNLRNKKWGEAIVAIAGPASNVLIALIFAVILQVMFMLQVTDQLLLQGMFLVVVMNLFLAIFNMIPVPPLDGSKILFAFLKPSQRHIRLWLEQYSLYLFIALLFVLLNTSFISEFVFTLSQLLIG